MSAQTGGHDAIFDRGCGTDYSSGALVFGGGDSQGEQNKYYRAIIERKDAI